MEGFEMQASDKSAGQPGAPRGSVVELAHRASVETMTEAFNRVLAEIAALMQSQRALLTQSLQSDPDGELRQAACLQAALCGWIADEAAAALGAGRCHGDAADWLLPSVTSEALSTIRSLAR